MDFQTDVATRLHDVRPAPLIDMCGGEIVVLEGVDRGRRLTIGPVSVRIGTGVGAQLRLSDPTVSRLHCHLTPRKDGLRLTDQGSTNGTFVDGVRVRDVDLIAGSTLRIGATTIRIELAGEPVRVALSNNDRFGCILGGSIEMRRLYATLERVAPTDSTVLIQGETGTGKELVARELHRQSPRAGGPFVAVDCGAIAPNVIESELFGHVRGAFSGAVAERRGLLEEAHGGTVFLDEIGELPLNLQAKLLRALETREIRKVGGNSARSVDVRLLAATNRPLAQSVNEGAFREDLYYRLAVIEVVLPPLRARREDIPMLAEHFLERLSGSPQPFPSELSAALVTRGWPGNVRELRNFIERCVTLGMPGAQSNAVRGQAPPSGFVVPTPLPVNLAVPLKDAREDAMSRFERLYVETVLRRAAGNVTRAAELAGVSRRFLQRTIARLGLRTLSTDTDDDE